MGAGAITTTLAAGPGPRFLLPSLALIGVLLLGALIIAIFDRWRRRSRSVSPTAGDQLSHFRALFDRGELSREEFERIRSQLTPKLKEELKLTPAQPEQPVKPAPPDRMVLPDEPPSANGPHRPDDIRPT
jgi:hypothetical protein